MAEEIKKGDRMRSFDFEGMYALEDDRACYVEGIVDGVDDYLGYGFKQYKIVAYTEVVGGKRASIDNVYYTPVNGTPRMFGGADTDGVRKIGLVKPN